jgi:outer membrane lipoprotein-sorting protein
MLTSHAILLALCAGATLTAQSLPDVLANLDQSAASFRGMTAQMKRLDYTAVIKDLSEERGAVTVRKTPKGLHGLIQFSHPDVKTLSFRNRQVQIYLPKINTIQIYDVGKYGDQIDQFLLLGFGTSGQDLQKSYAVKLLGAETVGGVKTHKLELTPKSKDALDRLKLTKLELWIGEAGHAVQEKLYFQSGDYKLISYSDVKLNPPLTDQAFELKAPKNAKKELIGK